MSKIIDITAARAKRAEAADQQMINQLRLEDYRTQVWQHECRDISPWEARAALSDPQALGLGWGPQASVELNPAV